MIRTLRGLRILNTRSAHQASALSQSIIAAGGIAIECPTLDIKATADAWIDELPPFSEVDLAIFISPNAVQYGFTQLAKHQIDWPAHIKVIAIGQGTARALKQLNIHVDAIPLIPDSEHLLKLKQFEQLKNQTVLLFKGVGGRELIEQALLQKGAKAVSLLVYERTMPKVNSEFLKSLWQEDLVDIILLTSEQSIHNLFQMLGKDAHFWLQNKACLVISERLAKTASKYGITKIIISHPDKMISTLCDYKD